MGVSVLVDDEVPGGVCCGTGRLDFREDSDGRLPIRCIGCVVGSGEGKRIHGFG